LGRGTREGRERTRAGGLRRDHRGRGILPLKIVLSDTPLQLLPLDTHAEETRYLLAALDVRFGEILLLDLALGLAQLGTLLGGRDGLVAITRIALAVLLAGNTGFFDPDLTFCLGHVAPSDASYGAEGGGGDIGEGTDSGSVEMTVMDEICAEEDECIGRTRDV
jgi:hypothetical protein